MRFGAFHIYEVKELARDRFISDMFKYLQRVLRYS